MRHLLTEKFYNQNPKRWFRSILKSTEELPEHPVYVNSIFYKIDDEVVFEFNKKNGDFYIKISAIWSVFKEHFKLNFDEIQQLTKGILEEHYKLKGLTPYQLEPFYTHLLEEHYMLKGITPRKWHCRSEDRLQEHYMLKGLKF